MTNIKTIFFFACFIPLFHSKAQDTAFVEDFLKTAEDFKNKMLSDSAIIYYEKAALSFEKSRNSEKSINAYNQIGTLLNRQDKYEQAKSYLEKALAIGRAIKDTSSLAIATTYITLGVSYGAEDQFEQSLIYHNKALSIRLSKLDRNSSDIATSYGNIGNIYFRKKDYDKAIEAHFKAKQIREKIFGESSSEVIQSYTNLGNAYKEKKNYKKALNYYEKAFKNKSKQLGKEHKDLLKYYKSLSEVYDLMGKKPNPYKSKVEEMEKALLVVSIIEEKSNPIDSVWQKITISKNQCKTFGIPEVAFSIMLPPDFSFEYHHKTVSAIRIYKKEGEKITTEISIGTSIFKEKYSIEQEKKWLEEFKNFPEIKNNPDFSVQVFSGFQILLSEHNYYVMSLKNENNKYPTNIPLNSVGITHASADGWNGLAVVVSKYTLDSKSPLSEIEKEIINTIKFE